MQQQTYVTKISNQQVSATLIGLVCDYQTEEIYYASVIGPQASLKSIWATLVARKAQIRVSSKYVYRDDDDGRRRYVGDAFPSIYRGKGAKGFKSFWTPLPGTAWQHMVAVSGEILDGDIALVTNPQGIYWVGDERKALVAEAEEEFLRRFVANLNATTEVPVLPEWGKTIFTHAHELRYNRRWVKSLDAYGDAIVAYRVDASSLNVYRAVLEGVLKMDISGKEVAQ